MPLGDKVGDAYIEVTPVLNDKAFQTKAKKMLDAQEKLLGKKQKEGEIQRLNASIAAQKRLFTQKQKAESDALSHSIRLIDAQEKRQNAADQRRIKAVAHVASIRAKAEKESLDEAYRINVDFDRKIDRLRNKKRRGKDGGILNLGESVEQVLSVLPGQLEKLFRSPVIAGAAAAIGATFGSQILGGLAGALGGAVQGGLLTGGIVLALANDVDLRNAGKQLGLDIFGQMGSAARETLKPAIEDAFSFIKGSNLGTSLSNQLRGIFRSLAPNLTPLISNISAGVTTILTSFQKLADGPFLKTLGEGFKAISDDISAVFNDISDHAPAVNAALKDMIGTVSNLVLFLGKAATTAAEFWAQLKSGVGDNVFEKNADGAGRTSVQMDFMSQAIANAAKQSPELAAQLAELDRQTAAVAYNTQREAALTAASNEEKIRGIPITKQLSQGEKDLATATNAAYQAQRDYDNQIHDSINALLTFIDNEKRLKEQFSTGSKAIGYRTQKQQDNLRVVNDQIKAAKDVALKIQEETHSADEGKKKYQELTSKIIADTGAKGKNKDAIQEIINKYGEFAKVPSVTKNIKIAIPNISAITATVQRLTGNKTLTIDTVQRNIVKNTGNGSVDRATGGPIHGPGTGTSDSIPANLSNGEFVIKAKSAQAIGMNNLAAMNSSGKMPQGFATGGAVKGHGRGATSAQNKEYSNLLKQMATLTTTIATQTKGLAKFNETVSNVAGSLNSFVNLSALDTSKGTAGDLISQLSDRKAKAKSFETSVKSLKTRGLSEEALQQILSAGPDSDLAQILNSGLGAVDIPQINALLAGDEASAARIGESIYPGSGGLQKKITANQKSLATKKTRANKIKPVKAKGATISYAGGKTTALFSKKELQDQQLKAGTYVTVVIDGKEVRALVKEEQAKTAKKSNQNLKSGRR